MTRLPDRALPTHVAAVTSRRTLLRSAVWTAPVITVATAAPAWAAVSGGAAAIARASDTSGSYRTQNATGSKSLSVLVTDSSGVPVSGVTVDFTLTVDPTWQASLGGSASGGVTLMSASTDGSGIAVVSYTYTKPSAHAALLRVSATVATPSGPLSVSWSTRFRAWVLPRHGAGGNNLTSVTMVAGERAFAWGSQSTRGTANASTSTIDYIPAPVTGLAGVGAATPTCSYGYSPSTGNHGYWYGVVDTDGAAWAGGSNMNGQAGIRTSQTASPNDAPARVVTAAVSGSSALPALPVSAISAGDYHQAIVVGGNVYVCGQGTQGELGNGTVNSAGGISPVPVAVSTAGANGSELPAGAVTSVAVVGLNSGVLFQSAVVAVAGGNLYGWGARANLPDGGATGAQVVPKALVTATVNTDALGVVFSQVTSGSDCAFAIGSRNGVSEIYSWGSAGSGRLGNGSTASDRRIHRVTVLPAGRTWTKVSAGSQGALALTDTGEVWVWGGLRKGDGTNTTVQAGAAVQVVVNGRTFTDVLVTGLACFVLADDGVLYSWSAGTTGQGGTGTVSAITLTPTPVVTTNVMAG